ncbi:hypothetical protein [Microbacterium sp. NPDC091662]|uniref:hypothetical protein n=1 Tax=Microbacterium sp. NPDC091662 TaxID=3364211 RepID=UPI00381186EA
MPQNIRIKINSAGARAVLQSPGVAADGAARGARIAAAAGPGFEVESTTNSDRAVTFVRATTKEARAAEANSRALTRAVNAGR